MAETTRKKAAASTVLLNMDKPAFAKILRTLEDEHKAADDAAMSVASAYGKMKKQGVNLDALRLVRKLHALGNAAKASVFLADFDRMRQLAGFDDQLALFESDKAAPQKAAETASEGPTDNVVQHPSSAKAEKAAKAEKRAKKLKAIPAPDEVLPASSSSESDPVLPSKIPEGQAPSRAKLFSEDDDAAEVSAEEKARQGGLTSGKLGEEYRNPYPSAGAERDAWHKGWVKGDEAREADEKTARQSA